MTSLQTILENDKERFLQNASAANNRQEVIRVCEDELGRILYTYNEAEPSDLVKEEASRLIKAVKPSLNLADTEGETKVYRKSAVGRSISARRPKSFPFLLGGGLTAVFAAMVLLYANNHTNPQNIYPIICLTAAGGVLLLLAGRMMKKTAAETDDDISTETMPDLNRIYRSLLMTVVTLDQILEDVRGTEERAVRKERHDTQAGLDDKTIGLFSRILEEAYADQENTASSTILSDVKFFLHARGIEAVDYTDEHRNWFDRMPGKKNETLRPALVMDDVLLKKGLASGGR